MKTFRIYHSDGVYFLIEIRAASRSEALCKAHKLFPNIKGAFRAIEIK